ncbi:ImcF-related family protein, partial [Providencia rettgeri]|nr:type VI secretion protein VasK [Providencia rettgeri]
MGSLILFTFARFVGKESYKANLTQADSQPIDERYKTRNEIAVEIADYLHFHYGLFWRKKVSIQLLIGSPSAVDKLAPRLSHEIWQESNGTVLIYGGEVAATVNDENVLMLKQLRRRRPVDALIWVTENTVID